jgi:GNAT superfamily N-acetyltransferase
MTFRVVSEDHASEADRQAIRDRLDDWNLVVTSRPDWFPVSVFLRDEQGTIRGGAIGNAWASWLHVDFLWVDEDCRRHGWGARLLEAVETRARERGCTHAHLDTFSFQAGPRFYERFGYRLFGVLADHPHGHTHYFLWKTL